MKPPRILSINQPGYLPWSGYFDRIAKSDLHVVLDHVQFEKNSFVNRNKILGPSGPFWLTVPLRTKGRFGNLQIVDLEIDATSKWRRKHLDSIRCAYAKASYFEQNWDPIKDLLSREWTKHAQLCRMMNQCLLDLLGIDVPLEFSSDYTFAETKGDLILEICRHFHATTYLSGPFGRDYLDLKVFEDEGIRVEFHDYTPSPYPQPQGDGEFFGNLSVIDLLFNTGSSARSYLTSAG